MGDKEVHMVGDKEVHMVEDNLLVGQEPHIEVEH